MFLFLVCFVVFFCQRFQIPWPYGMWPVLFLTQLPWGWSCSYINADILSHKLLVFTSADVPRLGKSRVAHVSMFSSLLHTRCLSPGSLLLGKTLFCLWEALVIYPFSLPSFGCSTLFFCYGHSLAPAPCVWLTHWSILHHNFYSRSGCKDLGLGPWLSPGVHWQWKYSQKWPVEPFFFICRTPDEILFCLFPVLLEDCWLRSSFSLIIIIIYSYFSGVSFSCLSKEPNRIQSLLSFHSWSFFCSLLYCL